MLWVSPGRGMWYNNRESDYYTLILVRFALQLCWEPQNMAYYTISLTLPGIVGSKRGGDGDGSEADGFCPGASWNWGS